MDPNPVDAPLLNAMIDWFGQHPGWAGAVVFVLTLAGALVIVGMFVYAGVVLFAIGVLVGTGGMGLSTALTWAIAGTVVGDGLSYWVGRQFEEHLCDVWPFRRHPRWLTRGQTFFIRYGGKGLFLGRFVGPIIPAAAGMIGIPPRRFFAAELPSAVLWVLVFVLAGMVVGARFG